MEAIQELNLTPWLASGALILTLAVLAFGFDDLSLLALGIFTNSRPTLLPPEDLELVFKRHEKRVAVLIANWREHDVLENMVRGNRDRIQYKNYVFFLGVYPNDEETWGVARRLEGEFENVEVIVNSRHGPTTKGQLLNEMVRQIFESEKIRRDHFDLFLLHDAEDLIHPLSFKVINHASDRHDFIQLPVFSLPTPRNRLVAGTYIDEFADAHAREMILRTRLRAPIPSAGVGTALSRNLIRALKAHRGGDFLSSACLTEDYELGYTSETLGFESTFICHFIATPEGRDFIATREYFPDSFWQSIRQKTRWTLGIAFQSKESLGWSGDWKRRYFLWRDRRSIWNAGLLTASTLLLVTCGLSYFTTGDFPDWTKDPTFASICWINLYQMGLRLILRMEAVAGVYGVKESLLVPLRWPVANVINTWAALTAAKRYRRSRRKGERLSWTKTMHRLPAGFGTPAKKPGEAA